jgi:hypothetical protein
MSFFAPKNKDGWEIPLSEAQFFGIGTGIGMLAAAIVYAVVK